jgi:PiT family inorganic phosphate transporter
MPELELILLIVVKVAALAIDYINGFHDTANAIATSISTRAMTVRTAIVLAATLNFLGAMAFTKVAKTIGTDIVISDFMTQLVVLSGVLGAIIWNLITWYYGLPSSSSHAIIGGIMGAGIAHAGFTALKWAGLKKIVLALVISPILGAVVAYLFVLLFSITLKNCTPTGTNRWFRRLQILSTAFLSFSHGTADAQKAMGVITMALLSYGAIPAFDVPLWVKLACATTIALGTAAGGWRIIKTVGKDFVKLQPMTGFSVDSAATSIIFGASLWGLPTSSTHVVTSAIMGVGLTKSMSSVNWTVAKRIAFAWLLTIPASAAMAYVAHQVLLPIFNI